MVAVDAKKFLEENIKHIKDNENFKLALFFIGNGCKPTNRKIDHDVAGVGSKRRKREASFEISQATRFYLAKLGHKPEGMVSF